ncbi:MAG TPA: AAA family ATPase [Thermoanaerobaculia bacterium]|nr:AAA family ATPase [Thermoanaerobaculia bacterium]
MITPQEIFDALRGIVVGQDDALEEVSVALVKHLVGHPAGNILLVGNSGSGKTTLMRAVEGFLESREELKHHANIVRINANVLAEDRQGTGRAVFDRLYRNAVKMPGGQSLEEIIHRMERGIVFVDEVDKIRASVGGVPNVRGIVAQEALLTLMENENVEFEIEAPLRATVRMNTASLLFVAGGAFEELYDDVLRRATIGTDVVPLKPVVVVSQSGDVREELPFHLRYYLRYDDLFRYGMTPQFISRFESIIVLNDLGESELARIFIDPDASIFRISREYFQRFDVELQITRAAVQAIAWEASRQKRLGARALREVYRKIIRSLEFDPRQRKVPGTDADKNVIVISEEMVKRAIQHSQQGAK